MEKCTWNIKKCQCIANHVVKRPEWDKVKPVCEEHSKDIRPEFLFKIER